MVSRSRLTGKRSTPFQKLTPLRALAAAKSVHELTAGPMMWQAARACWLPLLVTVTIWPGHVDSFALSALPSRSGSLSVRPRFPPRLRFRYAGQVGNSRPWELRMMTAADSLAAMSLPTEPAPELSVC